MAADATATAGRPRLAPVLTTAEVIDQFRAGLAARDIVPPENIIADGCIHRCDVAGKNGKGDAAYLLHLDGIPAGGLENWRDGKGWESWRVDIGRALTPAELDSIHHGWRYAGYVLGIDARVPDPDREKDPNKRGAIERALTYMGLPPGKPLNDITIDKVFIGSCTNSRIEDMREAAAIVKKLGRKVDRNVKLAMVVPGSGLVKEQAEREGLHEIFTAAGFEWREPGCSMCLAMNADRLEPGERCASTSNRNFEGRQGAGGRTHLVSPAMAAAAALSGHLADVRKLG